jgi:hypothetical protein
MLHSRIDYPRKDKEVAAKRFAAVRAEDPPTSGGKARNVVSVEELEKHRRRAAGDS